MAEKEIIDIKKNSVVGELIKRYPDSVQIMLDHGIECVGCHVATWESIEQAAESNNVDTDSLIADLRAKLGGRYR